MPTAPDPSWFSLLTPGQQIALQVLIFIGVLAGMAIKYFRTPSATPEHPAHGSNDVVLPSLSATDMRPWRETSENTKAILDEAKRQTEILSDILDVLTKTAAADEIERRAQVRAAEILRNRS